MSANNDKARRTSCGTLYRPDIDGLRAIAVSLVVLHHAFGERVPGGYIGVDVFFVISGYLIGRILLDEHRAGGVSLSNFYHRRILRIIPAYYLSLLFTYLAGLVLLMPGSLESLADSVQRALIFISNFWFAKRVDYFDEASTYQFLLHTWSLSVEEQFYVVFPLVLIAARYFKLVNTTGLILVFFFVSLAATVLTSGAEPTRAYYWPHLRAWEILSGTLLATQPGLTIRSPVARGAASSAGIVMILFAALAFGKSAAFPSLWMTVPCLGAVLIIVGGAQPSAAQLTGFATRFLSSPPLVAVGLISFSLYLYHWPVFGYARLLGHDPSRLLDGSILIALSVALAFLSWKFVEQPIRALRNRPPSLSFVLLLVSSLVLFLSILPVELTGGFPQRLHQAARSVLAVGDEWRRSDRLDCMKKGESNGPAKEAGWAARTRPTSPCRLGVGSVQPSAVLWGDSHAASFQTTVDGALHKIGAAGVAYTKAGCPPLPGSDLSGFAGAGSAGACTRFNDRVLQQVLASDARLVIIHARWASLIEGGLGEDLKQNPRPDKATRVANRGKLRQSLARLKEVIAKSNKRLLFVQAVPEIGTHVPRSLARSIHLQTAAPVGRSRSSVMRRQAQARAAIASALGSDTPTFDIVDVMCAKDCPISSNEKPLYFDTHHLTLHGGVKLVDPFARFVTRQLE